MRIKLRKTVNKGKLRFTIGLPAIIVRCFGWNIDNVSLKIVDKDTIIIKKLPNKEAYIILSIIKRFT
jgi:bifunctional DNA-binding transcriptional regulator/antitoxin component of YhaV-PrlF toxin-antitoxin module